MSDSWRVRMFSLNSAGGPISAGANSFRGQACIGELGEVEHMSATFRLLAGYCAQAGWFTRTGGTTDVDDASNHGVSTVMANPSPNPASGSVRLGFGLKNGENGSITVYDAGGRRVRTIVENLKGPIRQSLTWDLTDQSGHPIAPGVYFARLRTDSITLSKRIVIVGH